MVLCANGWTLRKRQEECHDKLIECYKKLKIDLSLYPAIAANAIAIFFIYSVSNQS